jgi:hypothetical protein
MAAAFCEAGNPFIAFEIEPRGNWIPYRVHCFHIKHCPSSGDDFVIYCTTPLPKKETASAREQTSERAVTVIFPE